MKYFIIVFSFLFVTLVSLGQNTFPASGSVGIGTLGPNGKLQIVGNSGWDTSTRMYLTNGSTDYGRTNFILTGRLQGGNDAWSFGSNGRNAIVFSSNNSVSGANVGGLGTEQFSLQHELASNSLGFLSQTQGANPIMVLKQSGYMGIGTSNPQGRLHVANGSIIASDPNYNDINVRLDGTSIPAIKFTRYTGSLNSYHNAFLGQFWNSTLGQYSLGIGTGLSASGDQNATTNALAITLNGDVGIGTSVPSAKLDVGAFLNGGALGVVLGRLAEGNSSGSGTFLGVKGYDTQPVDAKSFALEHSFYGSINSSINFVRGGGVTGGYLTFNTNDNSEKMRIHSNGNVGIGTTDPKGYKLAVAGKAIAEEVTVKLQANWPDYVFEPTYNLSPLDSIKTYIDKNKHLPEVPSAKEMEKNGVNLGEMNMLLLKKIEELSCM